jgi:hypothetical protein
MPKSILTSSGGSLIYEVGSSPSGYQTVFAVDPTTDQIVGTPFSDSYSLNGLVYSPFIAAETGVVVLASSTTNNALIGNITPNGYVNLTPLNIPSGWSVYGINSIGTEVGLSTVWHSGITNWSSAIMTIADSKIIATSDAGAFDQFSNSGDTAYTYLNNVPDLVENGQNVGTPAIENAPLALWNYDTGSVEPLGFYSTPRSGTIQTIPDPTNPSFLNAGSTVVSSPAGGNGNVMILNTPLTYKGPDTIPLIVNSDMSQLVTNPLPNLPFNFGATYGTGGTDVRAVISPNGKQVAYLVTYSGGASYGNSWISNLDGTGATPLNPPSGYTNVVQLAWVNSNGYIPVAPGGTGSNCVNVLPAGGVVSAVNTPDGNGYYEVDSHGDIAAFGDATCYGSMGGYALNKPIVGMAVTPDGKGYYLVASDGGIFSFGDAKFQGSTGNIALNKPIVGMSIDQQTGGYWLVASDGGVFDYNASFYGSAVPN